MNERAQIRYNLGVKIKRKYEDETKYSTFYSNSKVQTILHDFNIYNVFEPIVWLWEIIQKDQGEGSSCTIYSVLEQNINILIYKPLSGSTYIKLRDELNNARKRFDHCSKYRQ